MKSKVLYLIKRYLFVFLACIFVLGSSLVSVAFASSVDFDIYVRENELTDVYGDPFDYSGGFTTEIFFYEPGVYFIEGALTYAIESNGNTAYPVIIFEIDKFGVMEKEGTFELTITEDMFVYDDDGFGMCALIINSLDEPVKITRLDVGIYYSAYDMFSRFIYGVTELTAEQHMVLTILSTCCVLFVVVVPFLLVWWVIRLFTGG